MKKSSKKDKVLQAVWRLMPTLRRISKTGEYTADDVAAIVRERDKINALVPAPRRRKKGRAK